MAIPAAASSVTMSDRSFSGPSSDSSLAKKENAEKDPVIGQAQAVPAGPGCLTRTTQGGLVVSAVLAPVAGAVGGPPGIGIALIPCLISIFSIWVLQRNAPEKAFEDDLQELAKKYVVITEATAKSLTIVKLLRLVLDKASEDKKILLEACKKVEESAEQVKKLKEEREKLTEILEKNRSKMLKDLQAATGIVNHCLQALPDSKKKLDEQRQDQEKIVKAVEQITSSENASLLIGEEVDKELSRFKEVTAQFQAEMDALFKKISLDGRQALHALRGEVQALQGALKQGKEMAAQLGTDAQQLTDLQQKGKEAGDRDQRHVDQMRELVIRLETALKQHHARSPSSGGALVLASPPGASPVAAAATE